MTTPMGFEAPGPDAAIYVISVAAELPGSTRRLCAPTSGWA